MLQIGGSPSNLAAAGRFSIYSAAGHCLALGGLGVNINLSSYLEHSAAAHSDPLHGGLGVDLPRLGLSHKIVIALGGLLLRYDQH